MVENSSQLYMPVAPAYAANSGMGGGFGYNGDWWLILILRSSKQNGRRHRGN